MRSFFFFFLIFNMACAYKLLFVYFFFCNKFNFLFFSNSSTKRMSLPVTENLDERIERIRKRDEELEKKYREAEEDRLNALKDNAMVRTGVIKDEDWPRAHKYDKLDFTYDQKPEPVEPESETITNLLPNEKPGLKTGRDYKKFADGQGMV